ncbi:hypothetical protein CLU79DRAFT_709028 [Phycomyces nitens]|nr:hypothetical protein CLU79DRAFT_709028 [Phycomyces nitens]
MKTQGLDNIRHVYTVWQLFNRAPPTINNIVFDGRTAVVHMTQHISPIFLPGFVGLSIPCITTLYFRETEQESGLLKIYKQEDSWTVEGLIQSLPLVSFWYSRILRVLVGKLVTTAGDLIDASMTHARKMSRRGKEIERIGNDVALDHMERLEEYRASLEANYVQGVRGWRECFDVGPGDSASFRGYRHNTYTISNNNNNINNNNNSLGLLDDMNH